MRKIKIVSLLVFMGILITTNQFEGFSANTNRKILISLNHGERIMESANCTSQIGVYDACFEIFEEYDIITLEEEISYRNIQDSDALLIGMPTESLHEAEIDAITRFVRNGGGILLVGEALEVDCRGADSRKLNSISQIFGVTFRDEQAYRPPGLRAVGPLSTEIINRSHPMLHEISKLSWWGAGIMTVNHPSKALFEYEGNCMIAVCEYGEGRVVFLSDSDFFTYATIYCEDNLKFVSNIFNWLTEHGGPYSQHQIHTEKGIELMNEGQEELNLCNYSSAKSLFLQSRSCLEKGLAIYQSESTVQLIETLESLISKAELGVKADAIFQQASELYESAQYENASQKFQEALLLYSELENEKKIDECKDWIELCNREIGNEDEKDSDSDGVLDDEDGCYNPGCIIVDLQGCPLDSDGDGVEDCEDSCPNQAGSLSNDGCPEEQEDGGFCVGTLIIFLFALAGILTIINQKNRGKTLKYTYKMEN